MPQEYLRQVACAGQTVNPLFTFLGVTLTAVGQGRAELAMPCRAEVSQGGGMAAGGILATLADEAMAHAVLSLLAQGRFAVTAEMNIRYLRGAHPDTAGTLTARARVVKPGRCLCVAEADVLDGNESLLARAGATFYVLDAPERTS